MILQPVMTVILHDSEDRAVEVRARYAPPTSSYFSRSFGNYLPGDPEVFEVLSIRPIHPDANVAEIEADVEGLEEAVRLAANEP